LYREKGGAGEGKTGKNLVELFPRGKKWIDAVIV